jgi:hypothetical protein
MKQRKIGSIYPNTPMFLGVGCARGRYSIRLSRKYDQPVVHSKFDTGCAISEPGLPETRG